MSILTAEQQAIKKATKDFVAKYTIEVDLESTSFEQVSTRLETFAELLA